MSFPPMEVMFHIQSVCRPALPVTASVWRTGKVTMAKDRTLRSLSLVLRLRHSACIQVDDNNVSTQEFESEKILLLGKK